MDNQSYSIPRATASICVALLLWEVVSRSGAVSQALFPPPSQVARAFGAWATSGELVRDLSASIWRAYLGLAIGTIVGAVLGLLTGRVHLIREFLFPILDILRPIPPVAVIPLVIVWVGIDSTAKVGAIAASVALNVWIATHIGARDIPPAYFWAARSLGSGAVRTIIYIVAPASVGACLIGIRNGIATAFTLVYVSELAGASQGIGYAISVSHLAYQMDRMIAALAVLGACAAITDMGIARLADRMLPWVGHGR